MPSKKKSYNSTEASQASTTNLEKKKAKQSGQSGQSGQSSSKSPIKYTFTKLKLKLKPYIYDHIYKNADIISKFVKFNKNQIIKTINFLHKKGINHIDIERRIKNKQIKGGVATAGRYNDFKLIDLNEFPFYQNFVEITHLNITQIFQRLNSSIGQHILEVDYDDGTTSLIKVVMNYNSRSKLFMIGFVDVNPPQNVRQRLNLDGQNPDIAVLPIHYSFYVREIPDINSTNEIYRHSSHFSIYSHSEIFNQDENRYIDKHSEIAMGTVRTDWKIWAITDEYNDYCTNGHSIKTNTPVVSFEELLEVLNNSGLIELLSFTEELDNSNNFYKNGLDSRYGTVVADYLKKMCSKAIPVVMRQVLKHFLIPLTITNIDNLEFLTGVNNSSIRHYILPLFDNEERRRQIAAHAAFNVTPQYNGVERTYNTLEHQDSVITIRSNHRNAPTIFSINQIQLREINPMIYYSDNSVMDRMRSHMEMDYIVSQLYFNHISEQDILFIRKQNEEWDALLDRQEADVDTVYDLRYKQQEELIYRHYFERLKAADVQMNRFLILKNLHVTENPDFFHLSQQELIETKIIMSSFYSYLQDLTNSHIGALENFYFTRLPDMNSFQRNNLKRYIDRHTNAFSAWTNKTLEIIQKLIDEPPGTTAAQLREKYYSEYRPQLVSVIADWNSTLKHYFSAFQNTSLHGVAESTIAPIFEGQVTDGNHMIVPIEGGDTTNSKYKLMVGGNGSLVSSLDKKSKQMKVLIFVYSTVNDILQESNYFKIIPVITKLSNIKSFKFKDKNINEPTLTLFKIDIIIKDKLEREKFIKFFNINHVALNVVNNASSNKEYFIKNTINSQVLKLTHKDLLKNLTNSTIDSNGGKIGKFCSSYEHQNPGSSLLKTISSKDTTVSYFESDKKEVKILDEKILLLSTLYEIEETRTSQSAKTKSLSRLIKKPTNLIKEIIYIQK